ncbi:MAG: hypothetical protein IJD98_07605 [Oscillospiraceae bacterium]|nr:hypothetical protein [Oscillospiraceae bacterium]
MRDEISLLQAQLTYKKRLEAMLKELKSQQKPLKEKVVRLEKEMQMEQKDMQRLEGRSLAAFFYYVTGQMTEKLDAERREYYAARVKYDAAARELEAIEQDIVCTEEDLADLADCEERYARAIEAKRIAIETAGTHLSRELLEKERDLRFLQSQEQELEEAIASGTTVLRTASDVLSSLRNMESVSYLDRLGNNVLTDMAKHETLDDAQKNVEQLQINLQRFNKELLDVELRENLQLSIDKMLRFSDTFFENLLAEATVPEKLRQARGQVDQALDLILGILRQLQTKLEQVRHQYKRVKNDMDALIVGME